MSQDHYERLQAAIPNIAEAVKLFPKQIQLDVYRDLVGALGVPLSDSRTDEASGAEQEPEGGTSPDADATSRAGRGGAPTRTRRRILLGQKRTKKTKTSTPNIDFRPEGKPAWREFAAEKAPATNQHKNVVAVYYLQEILGYDGIGSDEVVAAFRAANWRVSKDPGASIRQTVRRTGWLNTNGISNVVLTHEGRNLVDHDLPRTSS